MTAFDSQWPGF